MRDERSPTKTITKSRRRRPKVVPGTIGRGGTSDGEYYSKAIGRALDVIECFHDSETSLSLTDISRIGGLPESSLFRILSTLALRGYLLRTADGASDWLPDCCWG